MSPDDRAHIEPPSVRKEAFPVPIGVPGTIGNVASVFSVPGRSSPKQFALKLSVCLPVALSVSLSASLSVRLFVCQSASLTGCLSVCLHVCLSLLVFLPAKVYFLILYHLCCVYLGPDFKSS